MSMNGTIRKKTGKKLLVTLVSTDPSAYCLGVARMVKGNESELQSVSMQFKEGMIYRFSGVSFVDSEKKQYIAAPVKHVLDLRKTKREALLTGVPHSKPQPGSTVAEMLCLRSSARVDLVGLLKSQSAVKFVDTKFGLRAIAEFCVMDGSKLEGLTAEANFSLFLPATVSGEVPSALVNLQKAVDSQKPLALMGLYAKVDKGEKPEVSTSVDFHWFAAEGPKAMALEQAAQELLALQEDSKANVTAKHSYEGRDYSGVEFRQATVALLEASASASNTATQFLQVNFATIAAPMAGASLETQDGARLWITTCMRDCTGSVAIALTEKAILGLTAVESKAVFMNSYTADTIQFPMLASVRVVMEDGNAIVVEAAEQDYSLQPTLAMRELTVFGRHDDGIVCSALASLGSSIHHRVMVGDKPVDRALVLLCSTGKSVQEQIGPKIGRAHV